VLLLATGVGEAEVNELDLVSFTIFITSATVFAIRFSWVGWLLKRLTIAECSFCAKAGASAALATQGILPGVPRFPA